MKKKLVVLTILSTFVIAQTFAQGTTFGLRAGVNFQNLTGKDFNGNKLDNKLATRFHIGGNAEIPVAPDFFVQPGLLFSTKGAKSNNTDGSTHLSYVELPINFVYKPSLGTGNLILGFGPYVAYGVGGKVKNGSQESDVKFENSVSLSEITGSNMYIKPFDVGANFLAGYQFSNKFSAQLNTQLGLVKINPKVEGYTGDNSSLKNTGFGVSVGYRL